MQKVFVLRGLRVILAFAALFLCSAGHAQPRIKPAQPGVWPGFPPDSGGPHYVYEIEVLGNQAYVGAGSAGLAIVDVTVPANPVLAGHYNTGGYLYDLKRVGTNVALTFGDGSLLILDPGNPASPKLIGQTTISNDVIYEIQISGSHAFLACNAGLRVIDLSDQTNPVEVGSWQDLPYPYSGAFRVQVAGHIAYLTIELDPGSAGGVVQAVIDVTDPANPVFLKYLDYAIYSFISEIREVGHYLLAVDFSPFLKVYDNTDPTNINLVATFPTRSATVGGLTIAGNHLYVSEARGGVQVFDITNPTSLLEVAAFGTRGQAVNTSVANNLIYVTEWDKGLAIIPSVPQLQFTVEIDALPGVPFTVEAATDFGLPNPWTPLLTTNSSRMPFWFTDRDVSGRAKFYRVRQP